jgi:hypothetical protein
LAGLTGKFDEFMQSIEVSGTSEEPQEWSKLKEEAKKMAEINKEMDDRLKKLERQTKLTALSKYYYQSGQQPQGNPGDQQGQM